MSQSRKSLGAARRGPQRAHIPYRADDLGHGKKTGVAVDYLDHKSDEFEPFEKLLSQADGVPHPHLKAKKKPRRSPSPSQVIDEDGEMSMELDDTNTGSPQTYFSNAPRPSIPSSSNRSKVRSRPAPSSEVDYDSVPSPRPSTSTKGLQSRINGTTPVRPSSLRHATPYTADEPPNNGNDDFDGPVDPPSPEPQPSPTPAGQSDDDEGNIPLPPSSPRSEPRSPKRKSAPEKGGKGRQEEPSEEDYDRVEEEVVEDADRQESQDEEAPPAKKPRSAAAKPSSSKKTPPKPKPKGKGKQKAVSVEVDDEDKSGLRRGTRTRVAPLEWWRLERIVYGKVDEGPAPVPLMKEIIRLPRDDPLPLGAKRKRSAPRKKTREVSQEAAPAAANPEEGWDDETDPQGIVQDYVSREEIERRVAFTAKMVTLKPAAQNGFYFHKIFGDADFMAAGQLVIPPGGNKPSKESRDNTYIFYIIEGAINLKVHRTSFVLATGGMFVVPRGNLYYMENISNRDAKLFFAQARKMPAEDIAVAPRKSADSTAPRRVNGTAAPKTTAATRSSSTGAPTQQRRDESEGNNVSEKRAVSR